jgi:hypothetical protein
MKIALSNTAMILTLFWYAAHSSLPNLSTGKPTCINPKQKKNAFTTQMNEQETFYTKFKQSRFLS